MTPISSDKNGTPSDGTEALERLAARLQVDGWYTRIIFAAQWEASLRVVNPAAPPLNDDIILRQDSAGLWWFCWSFGERITHADNLDLAAARITQVLGCPSR